MEQVIESAHTDCYEVRIVRTVKRFDSNVESRVSADPLSVHSGT